MKYDYSIIRLDLFASGGVLGTMNIQLYSTTTINIELLLTANYLYTVSNTKKLASITLCGFSFSLLGISFEYGSFLDLELPYSIELNALGSLSAGLQYQMNTNLQLYVRGLTSSKNIDVSLTETNYPITGSFKARLVADIALRPVLRVSAIVFSIVVQTEGYLRLESLFNYPPFAGIPSNIYDYNPNQSSIYHWSYPSDSCSTTHLIQYHVQFGIRRTLLTFDVTLGNQLNSFISTYTPTHYQSSDFYSTVYELVSGCLFKIPYDNRAQEINLYLDIPYDSSFSLTDYFKTSITFDMAKVVNPAYFDQTRRRYVTMVNISLLPSATGSISDPNVRALADLLLRNQLNAASILYTDTKWLKLLLNDLTQQANNRTGLTTSSTTTTTTTISSMSTQVPINTACGLTLENTTSLLTLANMSAFGYTYYRYSFQATSNQSILLFTFQQNTNYWCLDDVSITQANGTTNLILNGGFETGSLSPFSTCEKSSSLLNLSSFRAVSSMCARNGNYSFYYSNTIASNYLWQMFASASKQLYSVSFWIRNLGSAPNLFNVTVGSLKTTTTITTTTTTTTTTMRTSTTTVPTSITTTQQAFFDNSTGSCSVPSRNGNSTIILLSLVDSSPFNYTYFAYLYVAKSSRTTLTFAFRQDRSYWCLDDISVKQNRTYECIRDGSFESGSLSFYSTCNLFNSTSAGTITSSYSRTGTYSYFDGSYKYLDYLSQTFSTVPQNIYEISFWLRNLGSSPNSVDVFMH